MTVGEGIKLLKKNGFSLLNQKGSHMKFGKGAKRITIVYHSKDSEPLRLQQCKQIEKLIKDGTDKRIP